METDGFSDDISDNIFHNLLKGFLILCIGTKWSGSRFYIKICKTHLHWQYLDNAAWDILNPCLRLILLFCTCINNYYFITILIFCKKHLGKFFSFPLSFIKSSSFSVLHDEYSTADFKRMCMFSKLITEWPVAGCNCFVELLNRR